MVERLHGKAVPGRAWTEEPFSLVRVAVGAVALVSTLLAVVLAIVTHDMRMLELVGALWAVYGLTVGSSPVCSSRCSTACFTSSSTSA